MLNNEEIIKEIDDNHMYDWSTFDVYTEAYNKGYADAVETNTKWADKNLKWVDVNEAVPEFWLNSEYDEKWHEEHKQSLYSENVLVYCQHAQGGWWEIDYACYEKHYNYKTKQWDAPYFRGISNPIFNVTHWMHLPPVPKNNECIEKN